MFKKLLLATLFLASAVVRAEAELTDEEKKEKALQDAIDTAFVHAIPIKQITLIADSKGCLWGLREEKGTVVAVKLGNGHQDVQQICRRRR